ncbi:hypothetical protein LAZ67_13000024 [Cordylochernes scorpioides]|uniref:Uncharacterized protein n=1 Tax=Cordylochernes scorpioides TaxID=51811 RepID=A0ABY6L621_9ARAC|nr:hypothetical protein LAZ67_13000024 [Cordylochernes scorpioides]
MPRRSRPLIGRNTAASRRYRNAIAIETPLQSETRRALRRLRYSEARIAAAQTMQVPVQRIQLWTHKPFSGLQYNTHIDYKADSSVDIGQMSRVCQFCSALRFRDEPFGLCCKQGISLIEQLKVADGFRQGSLVEMASARYSSLENGCRCHVSHLGDEPEFGRIFQGSRGDRGGTRLRTKHYKGMTIHPDGTRTYKACNNCPGVELTPTHIFSCPAMAAALQKIDLDPEQQLYTPKIVDIAAAVMEMYGDI